MQRNLLTCKPLTVIKICSMSWLRVIHSVSHRNTSLVENFLLSTPSPSILGFLIHSFCSIFLLTQSRVLHNFTQKYKMFQTFFTTNRREIFNFVKLKFFLHDWFSNLPSFCGLATKICPIFESSKIKNLFRFETSIFSFSSSPKDIHQGMLSNFNDLFL